MIDENSKNTRLIIIQKSGCETYNVYNKNVRADKEGSE